MKFCTLVIERVGKIDWDLKGLQNLEGNYMQSTFAACIGIVQDYIFLFHSFYVTPYAIIFSVWFISNLMYKKAAFCCVSERGVILNES